MSGGHDGKKESGGNKRKKKIDRGVIVMVAIMVILIIGAGIMVFAGPSFIGGPTKVVNLSIRSSTSVSSSMAQVVNSTTVSSSIAATATNRTVAGRGNTTTRTQSASSSTTSINATPTAPPSKATVMLESSMGAQHALFYEAKNQGYYAKQALEVNIEPGTGSAATIGTVAAGEAQFGFVDASTAINSISAGADVQIIGAITQTQPFAVFYLNSSGISSPADLDGKTYCSSAAGASHVMFPAFAKSAGVNASTIKYMNVNPPYYSLLISGECQFTTGSLYDLGGYEAAANQSGLAPSSVRYFTYSSHGITPYGFVLIANDKVVSTDPNLVEQFVNATYQGLQYVLDNQQTALNYMMTIIPGALLPVQQVKLHTFVNASEPLMRSSSYSSTDPRTLGLMNTSLMNQTAAYTVTYLKAKPIPSSLVYYTNDFLNCTSSKCG
jgi:NitT/TauT family transport system substrate-binding protein